MEKFSSNYMSYWHERVQSAIDGTNVPGDQAIHKVLGDCFEQDAGSLLLDLGCSYGRLFEILSTYSGGVIGCDIDPEVINRARTKGYLCTVRGCAENTPFANETFDRIVSWAVFDVVELGDALRECHRLLKPGGVLVFTGKNRSYETDDDQAFIAERNAFLKDFPNHFVDVPGLLDALTKTGFETVGCWVARRRGDFGEAKLERYDRQIERFYEFALALRKNSDAGDFSLAGATSFRFSANATSTARASGIDDMKGFFLQHREVNS